MLTKIVKFNRNEMLDLSKLKQLQLNNNNNNENDSSLIMYIIFIAVTLASILIAQQGVSTNQSTLESLPIWFTFPAAVLWAPIVEESIFRGVIRRFFKNNIVLLYVVKGVR